MATDDTDDILDLNDEGGGDEPEPLTLTRTEILDHANEIRRSYKAKGLALTLRQLYYQFVTRKLLPSSQKVYKRIGDVLTEARYRGTFPVDGLVDRGRELHNGGYLRDDTAVNAAVEQARSWQNYLPNLFVNRDRWIGQDTFVSVWVEKDALADIVENTCNPLGVSWFACRGYPSVSALWAWLKHADGIINGNCKEYMQYRYDDEGRLLRRERQGPAFEATATSATVLYFGDHDPDGWEIPRSAERNLHTLMGTYDKEIPLTFKRIALNMDQIQQYKPPPFEAKMTSARYRGYVDEHDTDEAWELDALDPEVLRDLIQDEVGQLFDEDVHEENEARVREVRAEVTDRLGLEPNANGDDDDGEEE